MASDGADKAVPDSAQKRAILVLGMHRSGTSALTGVLEMFGATTPKQQIPPSEQNPKGFFEAKRVARLNDRLLLRDDLTWDSWSPKFDDISADTIPDALTQEAHQILQAEFDNATLIALKDPRICRLVPFWSEALRSWERKPFYLLAMRNPMEVAQSLAHRNDFDLPHGLLLWMTYVLESEASSRGQPRAFSTFDLLMRDPISIVTQLHDKLGLPDGSSPADKQAQLDTFLTPSLRHHETSDLSTLPPIFARIYALMTRWSKSGEDPADYPYLDRIRAEFQAVAAQEGPAEDLYETLMLVGQAGTQEALNTDLAAAKALRKPELLARFTPLLRAHAALSAAQERNQTHPEHRGQLKRKIQQQSEALQQAKTRAQSRDRELEQLTHMLRVTKANAKDLQQAVEKHKDAKARLESDMHSLRKRRAGDQEMLLEATKENAALHALVATIETDRARIHGDNTELNALVARVENERARLEGEVNRLHKDNTELNALVQHVETQRHALITSMSWRLSRPVRLVGRIFRKLRR